MSDMVLGTTEDPYKITRNSSTNEKLTATQQYQAASAEWNEWLRLNENTLPYRDKAEAKLGEILRKYPYVGVASQQGMLVKDNLGIKTDVGGAGVVSPDKFPQILLGGSDRTSSTSTTGVANTDDGYPTTAPNPADVSKTPTPEPRASTGGHPLDPNKRLSETSQPVGSSVTDSPSLSSSPTVRATDPITGKPSTPSTSTLSRQGPPSEYDVPSSGNTQPVTSPGSSPATVPTAGRTGPPSEYEATTQGRSGPPNEYEAAASSDDSGASGSTGTEAGAKTDEAGTGRRESDGPVTVGQQGRKGPPDEYEASAGGTTPNNKKIMLRPNKLHEYVNWTYNVGWYMLEPSAYNSFVTSNTDSAKLRSLPIARSGGFKKTGQGFDFDLNIVSLNTRGVIGNNSQSPGSNMFEIRMQVMEPYGVNLIPKLKEMADALANGPHDQFQIPYLIEIKWNGYDDTGKPVVNIPETGPKLIPVQIINITFKITAAGTVYDITMVPFSQQAINLIDGVLRQDVQLYGDSLGALLKEGYYSLKEFLKRKADRDVVEKLAEYPDEYDFEIKSFDANRSPNDKLATEKITFPQAGGEGTVIMLRGMPDADARDMRNDPTKQYFKIRGGSTIVAAVTQLAKNSQYFQKLIVDTPNSDKSKPLELVKVVPVIKDLGKYDRIRKTYQKKVIYKVMPFYVYGEIYPYAGQADVSQRGMVKEYNYIFTGKNTDIIDLDLQFNMMYFRMFQKSPDQKGALSTVSAVEKKPQSSNPVGPDQNALNARTQSGGSGFENEYSKGFRPTSVQEYFEQQLNAPNNADLITLDLNIIGDPDWIPQDRSVRPKDVDINADNSGYVDDRFSMGIATDVDSVYVKIYFKTPKDYNDNTGLMELGNGQGLIGGNYKVITVESSFEGGRFTQMLNLVRVPQQEENKPNKQAASSTPSRDGLGPAENNKSSSGGPANIYPPAENNKSSSLGERVATALYKGEPNQQTPINQIDQEIQDYFGYTNPNPAPGDDTGN